MSRFKIALGERIREMIPASSPSSTTFSTNTTTTTNNASIMRSQSPYFSIRVVDEETGRGIPLVYLRTTYKTVYMTDSAGYVAFLEPGLMGGDELWVGVASYGYETPRGFLGVAGVQVRPTAGGSTVIRLKRTQIAQRLYRMTGYGIYRDSMLLGLSTPLERPVLNARVAGSDTVQCARFKGQLLWMWQDTDRMGFQLGNFKMTGATTDLLGAGLDPEAGINFRYYTVDNKPEEFARELAQIPLDVKGPFPLWVDGLTVVPDGTGTERLVGRYYAAGHDMGRVEEGLTVWNDTKLVLEKLTKFQTTDALAPSGHTIYFEDSGTRYAFYGKNIRVRADYASASDPRQYEAFTCLTPDGKQARRTSTGQLIWGWEKGGRPIHHDNADELVRAGIISADESPFFLRDLQTGQQVGASHVAVAWNPYLRLWVNIVQQKFGDTTAGEIWLSTARSPVGPWRHCVKVATHHMDADTYRNNSNDFYNPVQHYELMSEDGRVIYFSGTLTNTFSGNPWPTPYYGYNNIIYKLDLSDPRLRLPTPPEALWEVAPSGF